VSLFSQHPPFFLIETICLYPGGVFISRGFTWELTVLASNILMADPQFLYLS
jgi:hypothetical protein